MIDWYNYIGVAGILLCLGLLYKALTPIYLKKNVQLQEIRDAMSFLLLLNIFLQQSIDIIFPDTTIFTSLTSVRTIFTCAVILQALMTGFFIFHESQSKELLNKTYVKVKLYFWILIFVTVSILITYKLSDDFKILAQAGVMLYLLVSFFIPIGYIQEKILSKKAPKPL